MKERFLKGKRKERRHIYNEYCRILLARNLNRYITGAEYGPHIFTRFLQQKNNERKHNGGTGRMTKLMSFEKLWEFDGGKNIMPSIHMRNPNKYQIN